MTDDLRARRARSVAAFQVSVSLLLVAGALLLGCAAHAGTATVGRTWPIVEPDAMAEIEARVGQVAPDMTSSFGPRSRWTAMRSAALAPAAQDRTRFVVPFYTLGQDIRLPDGKLLYPKGFTFNPLAYVSLPQRLVIVRPLDLGWALRVARPADFILLASGSANDPDPVTLSERHGRALFILEERVKDRLGLTAAPVIVAQVGQKLQLTEVRVDQNTKGAVR